MQVFLFLEPLEHHLAVAGEHVPVEVAEVVGGGVLAVVGELDPAAGCRVRRAARSEPRKRRRETSERYSSFWRNSEVKQVDRASGIAGALNG